MSTCESWLWTGGRKKAKTPVTTIITFTPNPVLDRTLTVPRIVFNEMTRATASRLDWGGKGLNVSRALQALGVQSLATGFVGGAAGRLLERGLGEMGIATDFVHIAGETRTNIVVAEADAQRYIKVNEAGPEVHGEEIAFLFDRAHQYIGPGTMWILSGSLPPGVPDSLYAQLIELAQSHGVKALLDASGEPLRLGCRAAPYLVKPNLVEAAQVTGQAVESVSDALGAAALFLDQGIELVALSAGADGMLLASKQQAIWAKPPDVQALNPVGAGDALLAGVAWAVQSGACFEDTARWGVAAGTAAAMCDGVSVGTRAEVEALHAQVDIKSVQN
jgi:1-phosphofructokinase family hexose kinase